MKMKVEMEVTFLVEKEIEVPYEEIPIDEDTGLTNPEVVADCIEETIREEVEEDGLYDYEIVELLEYDIKRSWED